ncbi:TonB-dependent receptor [Antarcticibacterium flavum]|uniref:TonB-dependent receptor n=1 Tax=Antarcticibacterium flavum TaxID=2058175 RepID=A0A5B7X324_9FLAO|nr:MULTISPECIES: TonB-dependent receptor [Antarcticibacterium]MCM4161604.1 SusC/RagA family TonB-linked outer membrane protein [Antarcticibacterium sp. W02-3]QCY69028.1 TonB-dependent receptor [Antarcticibacterium flavum]
MEQKLSERKVNFFCLSKTKTIFFVLLLCIICHSTNAFAKAAVHSDPIGKDLLQQTVGGTVVDENGLPVPGVNIIEKGTTNGVITDFDGNYLIEVTTQNAVLVFSSVGFETREITVGDQASINVTLSVSVDALSEVVVIGYGTASRRDVTGAISSISEENLNQGAITNPLQQISGKAAGVVINQTGSEPGSSPSVRIRGITSLIGGNDPLVVVDGIQGNMDLLNQVPPSEIASIDILKDASATAIYGSRGAPGVLIVTTKKNREGTSSLEYTTAMSLDFIPKKLDMMDANQWWEQARINNVPASANHGSSTDWFDLLTQTGATQNHTLSFGGGTGNFNYRASVSAILQQGIVINSNNERYIGRIQATQKALDDRLSLTMNLNSGINNTTSSVQSIGRAAFTSNLISNAYVMRPTDPVLDTDGSYYMDPNVFQYLNPYAVAQTVVNEGKNNNLFASLNADLKLFDGFSTGWFGSWRKTDYTSGFFLPVESTVAAAIDQNGFANVNNNRQDEKLMNVSLKYTNRIGDHNFDGLLLYEWQNQTYQGNYLQARGFLNDLTTYNALQLGDLSSVRPGDISSYKNDRTLISFLGRLNYTFLHRYQLTLSMRRDGSSVFGENHKWGNFPSAAVAWHIDQEPFMANQELFDQLKLRGGYGITGNQQGLYPQSSLSLVGAAGVTYFGGNQITNFNIIQNANEDLRWETKKQTNVGLDFSLLNGRLSGSIDAFTATTDNLLFNYTVPQPPFPHNTIAANVGSVLNRGLETVLSYDVISTDDMTFTLAGNLSLLQNRVLNLSGSINGVDLNTNYVPWGPDSFLIEGQPIGTFNILQHAGVNEVGAEIVEDRNGDGVIDMGARSPDRALQGAALPTHTYAINPSFRYKNFDVAMVWRGSGGNKVFNGLRANLSYMENIGRSNLLTSAVPLNIYTSQYSSNLWLENGSFLRLENLTAGYNFFFDNKNIESVRVSLTGNNLALFTQYTGIDPELNLSGGSGFGGDNGIYPRTRSVALGLTVKLK